MVNKVKLELLPLEGDEECFLEIEFDENGDAFVEIRGQDIKGEMYNVRAQIPNPIRGGGDEENYKALMYIYEIIKNYWVDK